MGWSWALVVVAPVKAKRPKALVSDELWAVIEPLLPPEPPKPKGGRPRVPDPAALTGIIFVLKSRIPWKMLPRGGGVRAAARAAPEAT